MKTWQTLPFTAALLVLQAQGPPTTIYTNASPPTSVPLYQVMVVQGSAKAINYRGLGSSTKVDLKGTVLLPKASGVANIKNKKDGIHIAARFKDMSPASSFGGEFLTYVMWGISTEGRAVNLGELVLKGGKGKVEAIEQVQTFGLVVTAEPYFAVGQPSDVVVMENFPRKETMGRVEQIDAKYELLKRGQYTLNLADTTPIVMDAETPFAVYQARNAVRIAQAAGASAFAPDAYSKAENLLQRSENDRIDEKDRILLARDATQMAEDARLISFRKQAVEWEAVQARLAQDRVKAANAEAAAATLAQNAAIRQGQQIAAQNTDLETTNAGLISRNESLQTKNVDLRTELMAQLNGILQTRATSKGLIMSMSGVLFQNGKATLLPSAREKLAKIAGILSTYKGLQIDAAGHTDSFGSEAFNQRLSEERASNTRDFLVSQGVPSNAVTFEGFGESFPVTSNATDAGRQQNRRVELVVSGDGITDPNYAD